MAARKKNKDIYVGSGIVVAGIYGIYFITHQEWTKLLTVYLPTAFFFLACFFLFIIPTRCRFPARKGPCRNRSYGSIFGCTQYHWLMKARAKLGIGEQETSRSPARGRRRAGGAGFEAIHVIIEETGKDRINRRLGLLSACIGLITSAPIILTWIRATANWVISLFV